MLRNIRTQVRLLTLASLVFIVVAAVAAGTGSWVGLLVALLFAWLAFALAEDARGKFHAAVEQAMGRHPAGKALGR